MLKIKTLIFLFLLYCSVFVAQEPFFTHSQSEKIKTIQVFNSADILSYPVIRLGSNETITLRFDELADNERQLKYHIIHCNSQWQPSDLIAPEYINGFKTSYIDNYDFAFNTNIPYVNYTLTLPNELSSFKISGNYLIKVTSDTDDEALLYACFYVVEEKVVIKPDIVFVTEQGINDEDQQVNFEIMHPTLQLNDPNNDVKVTIQQNNRRDNMRSELKPTYIAPGKLTFIQNPNLVFKAGNEFRYFEATSTRYNTHGIESIRYFAPFYHMVLRPDEAQSKLNYNFRQDVNGKFFIRKQEADQDFLHLESDYIYVHFTIPAKDPFFDGRVFVNGDFTHNQYTGPYEMKYDFNEKAYNTNLLLKQGRYDYQYLFLPKNQNVARYTPFENNFFETENHYQIFCYFRSVNGKYDQLVGYRLAEANKK